MLGLSRLRQLREENSKLKRLVADLSLDVRNLPPGKLDQMELEFSRNVKGMTCDEEEPAQ